LDPYPSNEAFYEGLLTPGGIYHTPDVWEFEPGTVHYSNIGYQFLGYIVERVTGQPLPAYLDEHILDPLEMPHSGYNVSDLIQYHALPHERVSSRSLLKDTSVKLPGWPMRWGISYAYAFKQVRSVARRDKMW
jgi:CubicO group peptidase (beta-lactamase class C family)